MTLYWGTSLLCFVICILFLFAYLYRLFFKKRYILSGKHVCITGGSEGIGLRVAEECLRRGVSILTLIGRNREKLAKAKDSLCHISSSSQPSLTCSILVFSCDVTDPKAVAEVFKILNSGNARDTTTTTTTTSDAMKTVNVETRNTSPVDVLVNCAGICICDEFVSLTSNEIENQIKLNLCGTLYPCHEMMKFIRFSPAPSERVIVLIGSIASQVNIYGFVSYGSSKFGIRGVWEALSMEAKAMNIRVMCAFPPNTDTPGYKVECEKKPKITQLIEDTPGLITAEEVAHQILNALELGKKRVTFGFMGYVVAALTAGFSPISDPFEFLCDLILLVPARVISAILSLYWESLIKKELKAQKKSKME